MFNTKRIELLEKKVDELIKVLEKQGIETDMMCRSLFSQWLFPEKRFKNIFREINKIKDYLGLEEVQVDAKTYLRKKVTGKNIKSSSVYGGKK